MAVSGILCAKCEQFVTGLQEEDEGRRRDRERAELDEAVTVGTAVAIYNYQP